jgi:hypothetical protein
MMRGVLKMEALIDPDNIRPKAAAILRVYLDNFGLLRKELEQLWSLVQDMPSQRAAYEEKAAKMAGLVTQAEAEARSLVDMGAVIGPDLPDWARSVPGFTTEHLNLLRAWTSEVEGAATDPTRWTIAYQASKHGWDYASFCRYADGKPRIVYIIVERERGWLFGAYASMGLPQKRPHNWIDDRKAFVFTFTNPHGIGPFKTMAQGPHAYITHQSPVVIYMGAPPTIRIDENSNINATGTSSASSTFPDRTGKGGTLFTGSTSFSCADIFAITTA